MKQMQWQTYEAKLTDAEERYYEAMKSYQMEKNLVGKG
jgi:hypothetical protein